MKIKSGIFITTKLKTIDNNNMSIRKTKPISNPKSKIETGKNEQKTSH